MSNPDRTLSTLEVSRIAEAMRLGNIVDAFFDDGDLTICLEESDEFEVTLRDLVALAELYQADPSNVGVYPIDDGETMIVVYAAQSEDVEGAGCCEEPIFQGTEFDDFIAGIGPHVIVIDLD